MTRKPMTNSEGCLWVFISIVLTIICFGVIKIFSGLSDPIAIGLAILVSVFFTIKILGRPSGKMLVKHGIFLFVFLFGIKLVGGFIFELIKNIEGENPTFSTEEIVKNEVLIEVNDTIPVFSSNRKWKDNLGNRFSGPLTVRQSDFYKLENHIKGFRPPSGGNFWGNLYHYIEGKDGPSLDLVMEMFSKINAGGRLNQMEFADMVVSCIQDIPYSFVFQDKCLPPNYYEESIKKLLEDCPECCIGNVLYGIQNPVTFIKNLKGDCDTRTVLIYTILKHFDYDVAILNSDFYKHSILGLNIPGSGLNKIYKGKKYMLWETTAKYFRVGTLPRTFDDVTHWNVVLTSK